jgi:rod shape-determining protein MreC
VARNRSVSAVLGGSIAPPRPQPFPSRSRSAFKRRAVVGVLVLLSLVLITVSFREPSDGFLHRVAGGGATVLRPFEVGAERVARPFRDAYGYLAGLVHAKAENKRLRSELDQARQEANQGRIKAQQNDQLRAALAFIDSPAFPRDFRPVNTRVLGAPPSPFEQRVIIAAGSDAGIRIDAPVITEEGLVGRVTGLTGSEAEVTLLTDEESAVPALDLASSTNARGLVRRGQGKGSLILDRVAKDAAVGEGDEIVTAGSRSKQFPSLFPRGIAIGRVTSVGRTDTSLFTHVQIESFVDFGSLDSVIVLVSKKRPPVAP